MTMVVPLRENINKNRSEQQPHTARAHGSREPDGGSSPCDSGSRSPTPSSLGSANGGVRGVRWVGGAGVTRAHAPRPQGSLSRSGSPSLLSEYKATVAEVRCAALSWLVGCLVLEGVERWFFLVG